MAPAPAVPRPPAAPRLSELEACEHLGMDEVVDDAVLVGREVADVLLAGHGALRRPRLARGSAG